MTFLKFDRCHRFEPIGNMQISNDSFVVSFQLIFNRLCGWLDSPPPSNTLLMKRSFIYTRFCVCGSLAALIICFVAAIFTGPALLFFRTVISICVDFLQRTRPQTTHQTLIGLNVIFYPPPYGRNFCNFNFMNASETNTSVSNWQKPYFYDSWLHSNWK